MSKNEEIEILYILGEIRQKKYLLSKKIVVVCFNKCFKAIHDCFRVRYLKIVIMMYYIISTGNKYKKKNPAKYVKINALFPL